MTSSPSFESARRRRVAVRVCPSVLALVWLAALLFPLAPAAAQLGLGVLTGRIVDAESGKPLTDVVVTASSPALQGEQTVVSDASGAFRIPSLPPGIYTLRYEADGHRPYERTGVELRSNVTLRADAQLLPESMAADEVTIVARTPTVDIGSTRSGVTLTQDFTSRVPVAPPMGKGGANRSFEQLAEAAPTGGADRYGSGVSGTSSIENVYIVDGLSVGDPGFGFNGTPLGIDFIKETNIVTGGYLPEYGRGGGGVLEVVTKSGSNEVHGSVFGNVSPWQAQPRFPPPQISINTTQRLDSVRDVGFDLGGPIVKDKLWFYVGASLSRQSYTLQRTLNRLRTDPVTGAYQRRGDGLILSDVIDGTERDYLAETTGGQYIAKLDWSPSSDDKVELIHRGTPTRGGGDGKYAVDYATGLPTPMVNRDPGILGTYDALATRQKFDSFGTTLKWTRSSWNKRLTFDTSIGWQKQHTADLASDGTLRGRGLSAVPRFQYRRTSPFHSITDFEQIADPGVCQNAVEGGSLPCPTPTYYAGGPTLVEDRHYHRLQGREIATLVANALGHHIIKVGFDFEYMTYQSRRGYPGGTYYRESTNGRLVGDYRRYGFLEAPDTIVPSSEFLRYDLQSVAIAGFVQDSWSVLDKVTLNAGVRYDSQILYADQGPALYLPNQWAPRLGVIFDPTQQGRAKLFASYARYYQSLPLNIMSRAGSGEPQVRTNRSFSACNPSRPDYPAGCDDRENFSETGPQDPNRHWTAQVGQLALDPDLKPQSSTEINAGFEYEIFADARLGITYVHRNMNNVLEDMSRDDGGTYFLGTPGKGIASDFPKAKRLYDAGIVSFTKTFSSGWLAQASYTLSHLRGNWEGLFRAQTGQLDPGTNSDFDLLDLLVNRYGDLPADRRHEVKLFAAYDVPVAERHRINVGGGYRARSGGPTNYYGAHPIYGTAEAFILPRGTGERLPWVHDVDVHIGYTFLQTRTQTLAVTCDVFNLFNLKASVRKGQNYTNESVLPITGDAAKNPYVDGNRSRIDPTKIQSVDGEPFTDGERDPTFGAPLEYQTPITLRFGVKSTF